MDEDVGDEVTALDAAERGHLQSKESEYSRKAESASMLESREMITPGEDEYHETASHVLASILDGKNVNISLSSLDPLDRPSVSPHSMDDVGGMVEELTVRNYNNLNLAVVGTSKSSGRMGTRMNQWQHVFQTAGGLANSSSHGYPLNRDGTSIWEDIGGSSFSELLSQKASRGDKNETMEQPPHSENKETLGGVLTHGGIRTKILSKSGFSEFFVKNTLKGKGIIFRGPPTDNLRVEAISQNNVNVASGSKMASDASLSSNPSSVVPSTHGTCGTKIVFSSDPDGVNLREWLSGVHRDVNKVERLNIFRQIVDLVEHSHSRGIALHDLRPSHFTLLPSNRVKYLGSSLGGEISGTFGGKHLPSNSNQIIEKRVLEHGLVQPYSSGAKKQKFNVGINYVRQWPQFHPRPGLKAEAVSGSEMSTVDPQYSGYVCGAKNPSMEHGAQKSGDFPTLSAAAESLTAGSYWLEEKWYKSPEEVNEGSSHTASNIYSLGVFLFELLGRFDCGKARNAAMMDLPHRILPPSFLSENPKEAGFCLLLYPDPSSRPSCREILESELLSGLKEVCPEELSSSIEQDDAESELLLHFLITSKEHKQKCASKLIENITCLEADIEEIGRRRDAIGLADSLDSKENKLYLTELSTPDVIPHLSPFTNPVESRWLGNMCQLESAYFSMKSRMQLPETDAARRADNDVLKNRENWAPPNNNEEQKDGSDRLGAFFDGLSKYARYNKFAVRGILRNGEFNSSANVICSLSFDRDEDYFAAAGISKKIKIFEFDALFNHSVDIHYPVIEMSNRSKLSCTCWNNYIRNYLASTDYDGVVKLWDASTGKGFSEFSEHEKRAWSVDFSPVYPTKLASGSDDCSVKLWSINERYCLGTIRSIANVCCVQFSPHSTHLLAFGSADYRTYCYDLRNARTPWCVLAGHEKAVSYVKFLDSETVVTASTDNTLKLWDLNKTSSSGPSNNACSLTFSGHTNEKNFVGLSVANGYITCGSETNEVFTYYRSLPMPVTSCKFGSIDPISGKETDDDNGQFVSSVCWRGKSDMVVAANSSGCIKVLQMV
ncbi:hypothetical protein NL676_011172 [Syzygium grande]|nr:hypothetical protein NL676_011172 [Syzygium grande]